MALVLLAFAHPYPIPPPHVQLLRTLSCLHIAICVQCLLTCPKFYYLEKVVARIRQKRFTHHPKHSKYNNEIAKKL